MSLETWYSISCDGEGIVLDVSPPGGKEWQERIRWESIIRICFKAGGLFESDEVYIFTDRRPESYVIPLEANGGADLWGEIIDRGLFDAALSISIMTEPDDDVHCWPKEE